MSDTCPFCARLAIADVDQNLRTAVCFADAFPVSEGHTLVVARRHEPDFFALSAQEQADVWALVAKVQGQLARRMAPDGFNVGLNAGAAAGQTVEHAHVHVIPRFSGDVDDPRGGVRWLLPASADYWSSGA